mmetsp:Transcript_38161/g.82218  ORF Transcript_38161/g.82218 Transcript_38161/m.82218 type:complete len:203 (+) Transcript_38161:203-811(+)
MLQRRQLCLLRELLLLQPALPLQRGLVGLAPLLFLHFRLLIRHALRLCLRMVKLLLVLHLLQREATLQLCGFRRQLVLLPSQAVDLVLQGQQFALHLLHCSSLFTALPASRAFLLADLLLQGCGPLHEFLLFFGLISLGVGHFGPQLLHPLLRYRFLPIRPRIDTLQALLRGVQLRAQLLILLFFTFFQLLFPELLLLRATL